MKCIEDEIPFEVPEGWVWSRLLPLSEKIGAGSTPTGGAAVYSESGVKFIRSQNVYNDGLILDDVAYISEEINQSKSGSIVKAKDILLNITGGSIGRCALVPDNFDIANVNQHVMIIRLVELSFRNYIHNLITSKYIQGQIFSRQIGSGRGGLSAETLSTFLVPVPPLSEQTRIEVKLKQCISTILAVSEGNANIAALLDNTKAKILNLAIRGKLVPQDPNDEPASALLERIRAEKEELIKQGKIKRDKNESVIYKGDDNSYYEKMLDRSIRCIENEIDFSLPYGWQWIRLNQIGNWQAGATPSRGNPEYFNGNIPWLKTGDLNDGYISSIPEYISEVALKETSVKLNPAGSVLIAMYGATIGKLGVLTFPATTNQACCACQTNGSITELYLFYFLLSQRQNFIGRGVGGAQPNISKEKIVATLMALPPINEQKRIVSKITNAFSTLDSIEQCLN